VKEMSSDDLVRVNVNKRDLKVAGITTLVVIPAYEAFKKYVWKPGIRRVEEYFERKGDEEARRNTERTIKLLEERGYLKKPES